jgi:hypothetical protein
VGGSASFAPRFAAQAHVVSAQSPSGSILHDRGD